MLDVQEPGSPRETVLGTLCLGSSTAPPIVKRQSKAIRIGNFSPLCCFISNFPENDRNQCVSITLTKHLTIVISALPLLR